MRLGNVDLYTVFDGIYWTDGAGMFGTMPKEQWQKIVKPDEDNRIPLQMRCLLIVAGDQRILVDAGYGDKLSAKERSHMSLQGEGRLLSSLGSLGIKPEMVDWVINTHLHGDHCGGNTRIVDGEVRPTFPRATYCIQRRELAEATFPDERTQAVYHRDNFEPLDRAGQLRVLDGDTQLTDEVRVVLTPGHTPGHQCVVIESGGQTAMYLGDVSSWPTHMTDLGCIAAYDVQPFVSIETKRRLAHWAIENHVLLIFEHHPDIAAGYLHPTDDPSRFSLEVVKSDR